MSQKFGYNPNEGYQHYFKPAQKSPYPEGYKHILIHTLERFKKLMELLKESERFSVDTETTGLDYERDYLVGVSVACESNRGFYLPFRHEVDKECNLPIEYLEELVDLIEKRLTFWFNYRYDAHIFRKEGFDLSRIRYLDTSVLVWLTDTNIKMPSLKWAEKHFLGWQRSGYQETVEDFGTFSFISPKDPQAVTYAAADAISTFALAELLLPYLMKECPFVVKLDNALVAQLFRCEQEKIRLDKEYLLLMEESLEEKIRKVSDEVFQFFGYTFNLDSNADLGDALAAKGLSTGVYTEKTKRMSIKIDLLEAIENDACQKLAKYKRLKNMLGSFVLPFKKEAVNRGFARFNYKNTLVPCLTKETIVLTEKGYKSIADCRGDKQIWTHEGWRNLKGWREVGSETVCKVKTIHGYKLIGTLHHPLMCGRYSNGKFKQELKVMGEIKPGDKICVGLNNPRVWCGSLKLGFDIEKSFEGKRETDKSKMKKNTIEIPQFLSRGLARLMGFVAGDGSVVQDGVKLCFWEEDKDLIDFYTNLMQFLFKKEIPDGSLGDDHTIQFKFCSVVLRDFFKWLGVKNDEVPEIIKQAGPAFFYEYLGGYVDADGSLIRESVIKRKDYEVYDCRLSSVCWNRIEEIHKFLNISGFRSHLGWKDKRSQRVVNLVGVLNTHRFLQYIRPVCGRKQAGSLKQFHDKRVRYDRVESSEVLKVKQVVYDIMVEGELFIANGLISHNTGRLAAGSEKKNSYFSRVNIQAVDKPQSLKKYAHRSDEPGNILGWVFNDEPSDLRVEVPDQDPTKNVRKAILPEPGHYFVKIDYKAQELRIPANLSKEPLWVDTFQKGEDPHTNQAVAIWGKESYDSDKRKKVKPVNFGAIYGATKWAISRSLGIPVEEAGELLDRWWAAVPVLTRWVEMTKRRARRTGVVYTPFGRPRRLHYYFSSPNRKVRAFAYRTAVNSPIQGGGADILKIAFLKLAKFIDTLTREIVFRMTVHDELDFSVDKNRIDLLDKMVELMQITRKDWPVPMDVGLEIGNSWGDMVAFEKVDGEWRPCPVTA